PHSSSVFLAGSNFCGQLRDLSEPLETVQLAAFQAAMVSGHKSLSKRAITGKRCGTPFCHHTKTPKHATEVINTHETMARANRREPKRTGRSINTNVAAARMIERATMPNRSTSEKGART